MILSHVRIGAFGLDDAADALLVLARDIVIRESIVLKLAGHAILGGDEISFDPSWRLSHIISSTILKHVRIDAHSFFRLVLIVAKRCISPDIVHHDSHGVVLLSLLEESLRIC